MNETGIKPNNDIIKNIAVAMQEYMSTYQVIINAVIAFIAITLIIILIFNIVQMGTVKDSPIKRRETTKNILISGICLALLSMSSIIYLILLRML